jgi:hypothetical protein
MANDPAPKDWTPDQPLDKDDEEEVQREAKARARVKFLQDSYLEKVTPSGTPPKKKKRLFNRGD